MEVSRDAVIAVYQAKGAGHRLLSDDVVGSKKTVIASTIEHTNRMKTGIELEKSVFLDRYSENPEVLKKTKYFVARVRDEDTGKWKVEQHVKIHDQAKGEWKFEEVSGQEVRSNNVIDDGEIELVEDQATRVFEDHSAAMFQQSNKSSILAEECDVSSSSGGVASTDLTPTKASAKAKAKAKAAEKDGDSEEEELSPMEKMMQKDLAAPKAKAKAKGKAGSGTLQGTGSGTTGGGAGDGGGKGAQDSEAALLLAEVGREMAVFKGLSALVPGCEEALASLVTRLQARKNKMAKKKKSSGGSALDMVDKITTKKSHLNAISELVKAALAFEKKGNREAAVNVVDKIQAMKTAGITLDMLPTAAAAAPLHAKACVLSTDKKFRDSEALVDADEIRKQVPMATDQEVMDLQMQVVVRVMSELVRQHLESKDAKGVAVSKLQTLAETLSSRTGGNVQSMLKAIVTAMKQDLSSSAGPSEMNEVPCV